MGGVDTVDLARQFGAPLYVVDEDQLRANCRTYVQALAEAMPQGSMPLFAGKALCFKGLYPILKEEGMGADVVSPGEIYTALAGGFPRRGSTSTATTRPTRTSPTPWTAGWAASSWTTSRSWTGWTRPPGPGASGSGSSSG